MNHRTRRAVFLCLLGAVLVACGSSPDGPNRASAPVRTPRDVPSVLRNTIGAECSLKGDQPIIVSGYGIVVGLNGNGSGDIPANIRGVLEQDLISYGVGKELGPFRNFTPSEFIDHPDTAVCVVEAMIPPGAPKGAKFDVRVRAFPGSSTKSIEGGTLYTTRLYRGIVSPLMPDTQPIAEAYGTVFINPFADPQSEKANVDRRVGRVLNGGLVTDPQNMMLFLDVPSHSRARAIARAINSKFPRRPEDRNKTATGRTDEIVELHIPRRYRDQPERFVQLVRHTRISQMDPEAWAVRYVRALKQYPEMAENLSWCLRALGEVSIPQVQTMYDYSEIAPRMAALQAGARLGDPTVRPYLQDVAMNGPPQMRPNAIRLLGQLPPDASVNRFLRDLIDAPAVEVRIAAYEALDERGDPWVRVHNIDGKFALHTVPSADPLIYVTQTGQPKVVIFGDALTIERPVFVSAWEDRFIINAENAAPTVNVYYRDERGNRTTGQVSPDIVSLVRYLGHETTPESPAPGLDFTYSRIVSALEKIAEGGGFEATIYPERDLLTLELLRANQVADVEDRPEFSEEGPVDELSEATEDETTPDKNADAKDKEKKKQYVVPLKGESGEDEDRQGEALGIRH